MKWDEFRARLIGIGPETPLGRIVAIRSEDDKEMLKHFTPEQKRIRNEWMQKRAKAKNQHETEEFLEAMKNALIAMAGGVGN
jgi:hypothetical protein